MVIDGLIDGLIHPILGIDHLLAMLSVGVVSAMLGRRAIWCIPVAFVVAMAVGGLAGLRGIVLPYAEVWIAASLVGLGLAIGIGERISVAGKVLPLLILSIFVIVFGMAHGNAHGLEAPKTAEPAAFALGFLLGTSLLHLTGVAASLLRNRNALLAFTLQAAGMFTAALGLGLLTR